MKTIKKIMLSILYVLAWGLSGAVSLFLLGVSIFFERIHNIFKKVNRFFDTKFTNVWKV